MKSSLTPVLGLGALLALNSCYVWQPPAPQATQRPQPLHGGRSGGRPAAGANQPGAVGPAAPSPYGEPSATIPTTDPAAVVVPNPNAPVPPPTDSTGGSRFKRSRRANDTPTDQSSAASNRPNHSLWRQGSLASPGFVYSPFDKTAGVVDVQGMAPGTK